MNWKYPSSLVWAFLSPHPGILHRLPSRLGELIWGTSWPCHEPRKSVNLFYSYYIHFSSSWLFWQTLPVLVAVGYLLITNLLKRPMPEWGISISTDSFHIAIVLTLQLPNCYFNKCHQSIITLNTVTLSRETHTLFSLIEGNYSHRKLTQYFSPMFLYVLPIFSCPFP